MMFEKVCMRPLGAIEEVFSLVNFRIGVGRVAIWVLHFGSLAKDGDAYRKPLANEGGEGGCGDHIAV